MTALERVQTQVATGERPESQWNQSGFADGSRYTGQVRRLSSVSRSKMEESLRKSSKACKAAAAVTAEWIRDTHRSLQKQELRWESLKQEVRSQQKEVQNLAVEARGRKQEHEERLQLLENLVLQQGRALAELRVKYENGSKLRRQANPPTKRPTELFKVEKPTLLRDILKTRSAIGGPVPSKIRHPLRKGPAEARKEPGSTSVAGQPEADIRVRSLLERLNDQVHGPDQGKRKGVSVSLVAGTSVTSSGKAEEAPRTNLSKTTRTPTKGGSTIKKVAVKRKSAGQLDGEVGCGGHIRKPGGGKAAKLLPKVGASLQTIPGGEACRIEAEKRSREPREPSQVLISAGAIQLIDPRAVQQVIPPGHLVGASNPSQGQESVELQSRLQEAAGDSDTKLGRAERGPPKQASPSEKLEL